MRLRFRPHDRGSQDSGELSQLRPRRNDTAARPKRDESLPIRFRRRSHLRKSEGLVTQADAMPNAWVQLVIDHVCSQSSAGCDPIYSIDPKTFNSFLDWLQGRVSAGLDTVSTVHQVIAPPAHPSRRQQIPHCLGSAARPSRARRSRRRTAHGRTAPRPSLTNGGRRYEQHQRSHKRQLHGASSDVGHRLDVVVTAKNGGGSTAATSGQTAVITAQTDTIQPMPTTISTSNARTRGLMRRATPSRSRTRSR